MKITDVIASLADKPSAPILRQRGRRGVRGLICLQRGYPDFRPFMNHPSGIRSVEIDVSGSGRVDNRRANIAVGNPEWGQSAPSGWVWHHVEDARTMQLIPFEIKAVPAFVGSKGIHMRHFF